jgi:2-keto-4-pentenoate hydratase
MANVIDKRRVRELTELLLAAHYENLAVTLDPDLFLESPDEAYWVQESVLRALDPRRPTAWKISPPREGAPSMSSPTPVRGVKPSPAEFPGANRLLGVEAEVAFRFARTPKTKGKNADIAGAVEEAFVLIELCESRFLNWSDAPPLCRIADFQSHGGFSLGSGARDWRTIDFAKQRVELLVNGRQVASRAGSHPSGDPYALVEWAAIHCAARGMPLAAGDVVTTGTWTGMTPITFGDEVVARFPGIGEAALRIAA